MYAQPDRTVYYRHLGVIDYQRAWDYQGALFAETVQQKVNNRKHDHQQPTTNYLLFCQHPPVYTLGKSGQAAHLLLSEPELRALGAQFYRINRGGDITYHGPGQLVGYPILDLDHFFTDIHRYLRLLEEAVIRTLADYGLVAGRIDGLTGVWLDHERQVNPRKICALGVKASRWVTMHGFALNVNTDLRYFNHIVPCGIADKAITSMTQELGQAPDMKEVEASLRRHLTALFDMKLVAETVVPG
ncbi:MAG: lipoyl(octanoyl) transferase LipB [Tunicatimonas sp.]